MTDDRKPLPAEAETAAVLVDRLHIDGLVREWCEGDRNAPNFVSGLVRVLRLRLSRFALTAAPKATETPGLREALTDNTALCKWLDERGDVSVSWAEDPNEFEHLIEFTPASFRSAVTALSATPQPVAVPDDRPYCAGALAHIEIGGLCERHVNELRDHADKLRWQMQNDDRPAPSHGWTCFHCAQTFTTWASASAHFGDDPSTGTRPECVAVPDDGAGRDEVVAWRYEIKHGPDGESDYAWVYDETGRMIATMRTFHAATICALASALSAERAAHEQTRRERDMQQGEARHYADLALRAGNEAADAIAERDAEVARLRKALEDRA